MHYTQQQVRDTVGLSLETYRHWKRVLPPLADKGGRSACFSIGDLMAASIIHRLTETVGTRIGDLSVHIFQLCNQAPWAALVGKSLIVDLEYRTCGVERAPDAQDDVNLLLSCKFDPVLAHLRDALLRNCSGHPQAELLLPPVRMPAARRRKRA